MIDVLNEKLIHLNEAARLIPSRKPGRRIHLATLYRWRQKGLETVRIGGSVYTSCEAVERFVRQLNPRGAVPAPAARKLAAQHAADELSRLGI